VSRTIGPSSENTRSAILDLIRSGGVVSRVDLVEASGLTAASITRIVKALIAEGVVVETGFGDSTGGKRPTLLELNSASRFAIGLSLDDARLTYVVTDLAGNLVGRLVSPGIRGTYPPVVLERIVEELGVLLRQLGVARDDVVGIGLAGAGRLDASGGILRSSLRAADWEDFDVQKALETASGFSVVLEKDATCAALGEYWVGRIPASQDFATLYMATGIACGIVINGSAYGGASSNVGEIGHVVLDVNGPDCWCGSKGCLEMLAAPLSVVRRALADPELARSLALSGDPRDLRADFALIGRAAAQGDEASVALIEESASYLAKAVLSLANVLDLDRVYLAGPGFADAGAIYFRIVQDHLDRLTFMRPVHPVHVELSEIGLESAALGAAAVALQRTLTPHRSGAGSTRRAR
jgi:predicted NBD/HSP70 family sugar kinase